MDGLRRNIYSNKKQKQPLSELLLKVSACLPVGRGNPAKFASLIAGQAGHSHYKISPKEKPPLWAMVFLLEL